MLPPYFVWLQMCDIGDASRGSLSSYAYTLMVLFFLQQRNPPVIPVLQEVQKWHVCREKNIEFKLCFLSPCTILYSQAYKHTSLNCVFQIYDGKKKPEVLVDGWNVYFFNDLKTLVSILLFCIFCVGVPVNILVTVHVSNTPVLYYTCSPVAGRSIGWTWSRWGSCGSACSAFIQRTLTSGSMLCVSVSTAASPLSTSSGRPNTSSLKVSLCDKLGPDLVR